ncbi:MAG TPA: hypothetical protein VM533_00110 [Fimbriiglobus sp.]|jgi:hypothetical protein|nr:hypothetical protein [Fimbriiglobus sp.]
MSDRPDPLIDALARFTPATRLDRDEVLFQAGRASAPKARWWKCATALLLVTQAATLAFGLWPDPAPSASPTREDAPAAESVPYEPVPLSPGSYGVLSRSVEAGGLPPVSASTGDVTDGPTITVLSARRGLILD